MPSRPSLPSLLLPAALALAPAWPSVSGGSGQGMPIAVTLDPGTPAPADTVPPEEAVKLSAKGVFAAPRAEAGKPVEYLLRVEWRDARVPVMVLPPESLEVQGFRVEGQSATHRKTAEGGSIRNVSEFAYKLVPKAPGNAKVAPLRLRYFTGLANREEILYVPGAFLDVDPARVPLQDRLWFRFLAGLLILAGVGAGSWRLWVAAAEKRRRKAAEKNRDFAPEVKALKGHWNTLDSRAWIAEAENVCAAWLRHREGAVAGGGGARLEALIDRHLESARPTEAEAEGWRRLRELFHHGRYAGGRKEPHELQDAYRTLKTCLHIAGDET